MLQAALKPGTAHRRSVFEVFARRLPEGRRYGVVAGTGRLLEGLAHFRFGTERARLPADRRGGRRHAASGWPDFRFSGRHLRLRRGRGATSRAPPCCMVEASFAEACVLETLILSVLNHDSAIASAASRMSPPPAAARASRWAPGAPTRRRRSPPPARPTSPGSLPPPTSGRARGTGCRPSARPPTRSPCCTTPSGRRSQAQVAALGRDTTLLVDTYDVEQGVRTRRGGRRTRARRRPAGLRGPRRAGAPGARSSWTTSAHRHRDHGDLRPRRVRHRRAARGPRGLLWGGNPAGHRLRGADRLHGLQAGDARTTAAPGSTWPRPPPARPRWAGASSPPASSTPPAGPRLNSSASTSHRTPTPTTARYSTRSCWTASCSRGGRGRRGGPGCPAAPGLPFRAARRGA